MVNKGLEALERIKNHLAYIEEDYEVYAGSDLSIIETELKRLERIEKSYHQATEMKCAMERNIIKQDRILRIIKDKRVCISTLKDSDTVEEYNNVILYHKVRSMTYYKPLLLTKEEYDLLKEEIDVT